MSEIDSQWLSSARVSRRRRIFRDSRDDNDRNVQAWRDAIAAIAANDPAGMAKALDRCQGRVEPISRQETIRSNPCAKAVMALREDPHAWERLRQGEMWLGRRGDEPTQDWLPHSVDILSYFWAANPQGLALAAKAWREGFERGEFKAWSCPFLSQGYEGPIEFSHVLFCEARRLNPRVRRFALGADASPVPQGAVADMERVALNGIGREIAKACLIQLFPHAEREASTRQEGGTLWERGGSDWGVRWIDGPFPRASGYEAKDFQPAPACEIDILACAVDELAREALARSPQEGVEMARKLTLALAGASQNQSLLNLPWELVEADPTARAIPFPLGPFDWMRSSQLAALPIGDAKLGAWLAGPGSSWSAPAQFSYNQDIQPAHPKWSYQARHYAHVSSGVADDHLGRWSPLEWMLVEGRHGAARAACLAGRSIEEKFEANIRQCRTLRGAKAEQILAAAEACRLASQTAAPAPSAKLQARL